MIVCLKNALGVVGKNKGVKDVSFIGDGSVIVGWKNYCSAIVKDSDVVSIHDEDNTFPYVNTVNQIMGLCKTKLGYREDPGERYREGQKDLAEDILEILLREKIIDS